MNKGTQFHIIGVTHDDLAFLLQHPEQSQEWLLSRDNKLILDTAWSHAMHSLRTHGECYDQPVLGIPLQEVAEQSRITPYDSVVYYSFEHTQDIYQQIQELFQESTLSESTDDAGKFVRFIVEMVQDSKGFIVAI